MTGKSANDTNNTKISDIIGIRNIMEINLQIHETLSAVIASQPEVFLHFFRRMNIAWSQHFLAEIVDHLSVDAVTNKLLGNLSSSDQVGSTRHCVPLGLLPVQFLLILRSNSTEQPNETARGEKLRPGVSQRACACRNGRRKKR